MFNEPAASLGSFRTKQVSTTPWPQNKGDNQSWRGIAGQPQITYNPNGSLLAMSMIYSYAVLMGYSLISFILIL